MAIIFFRKARKNGESLNEKVGAFLCCGYKKCIWLQLWLLFVVFQLEPCGWWFYEKLASCDVSTFASTYLVASLIRILVVIEARIQLQSIKTRYLWKTVGKFPLSGETSYQSCFPFQCIGWNFISCFNYNKCAHYNRNDRF